MRLHPALVGALVALVPTGCGESVSEESRVRGVLAKLADATARKDYRRLCDEVLAPSVLKRVARAGATCQDALRAGLGEVRSPRLTVRRVSIRGGRAQATIHTTAAGQTPSDDTVRLEKVRGEWRVVSLAATATPRR